jgi:threonine aldolase
VESNIVIFHMEEGAPDAATIAARAREAGVLIVVFGPRTLRAVSHLDVSKAQCARAADILAKLIERG